MREAVVWHALIMNLEDCKAKSERLCSLLMQGMRVCPECFHSSTSNLVAATCTCCRSSHILWQHPLRLAPEQALRRLRDLHLRMWRLACSFCTAGGAHGPALRGCMERAERRAGSPGRMQQDAGAGAVHGGGGPV